MARGLIALRLKSRATLTKSPCRGTPALPGCHTQAKSLDKLMERIKEAMELCLEAQGENPQALRR